MVNYPRYYLDLERVPWLVNQKNFDKIQWKNNVQNRKNKLLRTGFEPGLRYPCSLATQLHVNYFCSPLSPIAFLFYYLI